MFGLMKFRDKLPVPKHIFCGTCKTIGSIYSQKSRLFLNNDIIFLNEMFIMLDRTVIEQDAIEKFKDINCFNKITGVKTPESFKFVAAVNMVMSRCKIQDNIIDNNVNFHWRILMYIYKKDFKKAFNYLEKISISEDFIEYWSSQNFIREKNYVSQTSNFTDRQLLDYFSEPAAKLCGTVFSKGIQAMNNLECESTMYQVGSLFGKIVYLLDSINDFEEDARKNKFNWLKQLNTHKEQGIRILSDLTNEITKQIIKLPLGFDQMNYLINSINFNVDSLTKKSQLSFSKRIFQQASNVILIIKFFVKRPNAKFTLNSFFFLPIIGGEINNLVGVAGPIAERVPICCAPIVCCCGWCIGKSNE